MNSLTRLIHEYTALGRVLNGREMIALAAATITAAPAILRTGKLTSLDAAMSRDIVCRYRGAEIALPLAEIDAYLAAHGGDNPTFGNVREMYAADCYLRRLRPSRPLGTVLDLGANRGMFSLLALKAFDASRAVGVEPNPRYEPVMQSLLRANALDPARAVRYHRFVTGTAAERADASQNVSIDTICREQKIERISLVKIDIEGYEKDLFREPAWLARVDALAMELHPDMAGDLSLIPEALGRFGLDYVSVGQFNEPCAVQDAMFLYASRNGWLVRD